MKERLAHFHQSILNNRPLIDWFDHTIQPLGNNLTLDILQNLFFYPNVIALLVIS
jgi:hypothetical protein